MTPPSHIICGTWLHGALVLETNAVVRSLFLRPTFDSLPAADVFNRFVSALRRHERLRRIVLGRLFDITNVADETIISRALISASHLFGNIVVMHPTLEDVVFSQTAAEIICLFVEALQPPKHLRRLVLADVIISATCATQISSMIRRGNMIDELHLDGCHTLPPNYKIVCDALVSNPSILKLFILRNNQQSLVLDIDTFTVMLRSVSGLKVLDVDADWTKSKINALANALKTNASLEELRLHIPDNIPIAYPFRLLRRLVRSQNFTLQRITLSVSTTRSRNHATRTALRHHGSRLDVLLKHNSRLLSAQRYVQDDCNGHPKTSQWPDILSLMNTHPSLIYACLRHSVFSHTTSAIRN
jgi:hypothetical protein